MNWDTQISNWESTWITSKQLYILNFVVFCFIKTENFTLWKFIFNPDNCSKAQRINFMLWACSRLCSKKRIVSSAYCRIDKPPSTRWGTTLRSWSSVFFLFMKSASISATILNNIDERGSPCWSPFFLWKKDPTSPLTLITTLPPEMKDLIHPIHLGENPFIRNLCIKKSHCTFFISLFKVYFENNLTLIFAM